MVSMFSLTFYPQRKNANALANSRANACTEQNLGEFFNVVGRALRERAITPTRLYNADEKPLKPELRKEKV